MSGNHEVFQQLMSQGHSAAWDQVWERAEAFYRQALMEVPNHPQALTSLALVLFETQRFDEALEYYLRAVRASPEDPIPLEKVAQLYERLGKLQNAIQVSLKAAELHLKNRDVNSAIQNWVRITSLDPENLQAHGRLAVVYERLGNKERAFVEYLACASLLQAAGSMERAMRAVNQALLVSPNHPAGIAALAMLRDFKPLPRPNRPRGGTAPLRMSQVRQFETPKTEPDEDPVTQAARRALTFLADLLFDLAEDTEAGTSGKRSLQSILQGRGLRGQYDRSRITLHLGQVVDLQTRGQFEQAAAELEKAVDAGLDHPAVAFDLGFLYAQQGRIETALRHLQTACRVPGFALGAFLLMGDLQLKQRRIKDAAISFLEALKLADAQVVDPMRADDLRQLYDPLVEDQRHVSDQNVQLSLCQNIQGLLMQANWRESVERARQQLPVRDSSGPPVPLAEVLTQTRSSLVIESLSLISELSSRGQFRSAMEEAFYALHHAPAYLPLHTQIAELLLKQGETRQAADKFNVIARAYTTRGEFPRAVSTYRRLIALAPTDLNARSRLIDLLNANGKVDEALHEYINLADIYYSLADLEMVRKTYTEALRLAQGADRSWRQRILHRMADLDMQSLDWRQAARVYEQIRTLEPEDEKARFELIGLHFRLGREAMGLSELDNYLSHLVHAQRSDAAIAFTERLFGEHPDRLLVRRRLADLYRQSGQIEKAVAQLDAVGEAMLESGDRIGAMQVIETIVSLDPPNKPDYVALLEQLRGASG